MFAILERLQGVAQDNLNATIRDRYYGAASCTPAVVFPRLIKLSMHHAAKADERGRWLEKLKGEVMAGLPAHGMPKILNLEEQGMFAIGYYHQRERFFVKKDA
ncbi:CRISPR-associated protein [compost metagenome]